MNIIIPLVLFVVGFIIGYGINLVLSRKTQANDFANALGEKFSLDILPKLTQSAGEQTALLAKEKLESASANLKQDFANKQDAIGETIKRLHEELQKANEKLEKAERERIGSFEGLRQQITAQAKQTDSLIQATTKLQSVLSNNQQRGIFGEQVAKDLLAMAGFTQGVDYLIQESQQQGTRPDFTVLLPNGMKINVDAKFPYQNLLKFVEATDEQQRNQFRKLFEQDIKAKIKQVTTRDYINPEGNTVDFVILFIPNEKIFSYIYDEMNEIWNEGLRQKVVFAGPFSFTAILRMVRQAYEYFSVQKNLRSIINYIQTFKEEFTKYGEEFDKLGDRIDSAHKQYQSVAQTRTTKLNRIVDKIQLQDQANTPEPARLLE